ncbi:adenosylcobinamide-GDP ribazoletransferase [Patulibacter sp.]|uniref:adenosylcobinamide-GDP ribazoletransferase n=1 Tax=Patulibacter sp. TaxID=1912859 RepID=UPI00271FEA3E|nr:adenosylcobinamide-GDP ribazoletransferase [Patulibacter sp.]MDO9409587.1 adenosylcobinamide-GDP ribazoletransferase [Patulibacter sp.]
MSALDGPRHAVGFLTRIPVPFGPDEAPRLTAAAPWFPVVGAGVGALGGGILALVALVPGAEAAGVAAALGLATTVAVTGALHEDGLADTADGLGVLGDRARRLEVMRDSRIGTFGALALLLWLLVAWSAVRPLDTGDAVLALVAAGALSRWSILVHALLGRPARPDGAIHALRVGPLAGVAATVVAVVAAVLALGLDGGAVAVGVALLLGAGTAAAVKRSLGGITGDTCGATATLVQAAVLVVALAAAA